MRTRWPEWLCIGSYTFLIAVAIPFHEPWADEAQAWQLARSLSPWQLLHTYVRYEGSPGLWYLLLWALHRAGVTYAGMHWACGAIAVLGVAILIFQAPLPLYLRLLLPFTFFLAFQYSIVARSYVLIPPLLFAIAALWKRNPVLVALLLGLLANVAGHATAISAGVALVYIFEQRKERTHSPRTYAIAAAVFLFFVGIAAWTAWPPRDVYVAAFHPSALQPHHGPVIGFLGRFIISFCWGICQPLILALVLWLVPIVLLYRCGKFRYLLPVLALALFSGAVYLNFWHAGLMMIVLVFVLWRTWPAHWTGKSRTIAIAALLYVIAVQIGWTAYAVAYDHVHDYSPDLAAARFIAPYVNVGDKVAVTYLRNNGIEAFHGVGILPYFPNGLYINQPTPFWQWNTHDPTEANFLHDLSSHPEIVIVEYSGPRPFSRARDLPTAKSSLLTSTGYALRRVFCATRPERFGTREVMCQLIFLHAPPSRP